LLPLIQMLSRLCQIGPPSQQISGSFILLYRPPPDRPRRLKAVPWSCFLSLCGQVHLIQLSEDGSSVVCEGLFGHQARDLRPGCLPL